MSGQRFGLLLVVAVWFTAGEAQVAESVMKVATIPNSPFLHVSDEGGSGNSRYSGFIKDLLDELSKAMGFRYELVEPEDGRYGQLDDSTGQWSGMVGMVEKQEVDLAAADLTVTAKRAEVLDFSVPFMSAPLTVLASRSPAVDPGSLNMFSVFGLDVWLLLLVAFVLTALSLFLVARISPYERLPNAEPVFGMCNSFWFTFSCFFRGTNFAPSACSTRMITAAWFLFGISVVVLYAVGLRNQMSALNASTAPVALEVEDLFKRDNFKFLVIRGGATEKLLSTSEDPIHRQIFANIEANDGFVTNYQEGMERVVEEGANTGIVIEGHAADYFVRQNCDLYTVGNLHQRSYALGFKRGSPIRTRFTHGLLALRSTGRLQMLINKWWRRTVDCRARHASASVQNEQCVERLYRIDILDLGCPFLVWLVLVVVAVILSIVELALYLKKKDAASGNERCSLASELKQAFCGCLTKPAKPATPVAVAAAEEEQ